MKTFKFLASFTVIVLLSFLFTQALAFADDAPPGVNYDFTEDADDDDSPPTLGGTGADDDEDADDDDSPPTLGGTGADDDDDSDPPPPPPPTPDPKVKKDLSKTGPETYVFLLVGLTLSLVVNRKLATKKSRN